VFHSPQSTHCPCHFDVIEPQALQEYRFLWTATSALHRHLQKWQKSQEVETNSMV